MALQDRIRQLRKDANLSCEAFAQIFEVSRQSVQKWESGESVPELSKLLRIASYFDVSLDALLLGADARLSEEYQKRRAPSPSYADLHIWEDYASDLKVELRQCVDEGLELTAYRDVIAAVGRLPKNEYKKRLGDVLFDVIQNAPLQTWYFLPALFVTGGSSHTFAWTHPSRWWD